MTERRDPYAEAAKRAKEFVRSASSLEQAALWRQLSLRGWNHDMAEMVLRPQGKAKR